MISKLNYALNLAITACIYLKESDMVEPTRMVLRIANVIDHLLLHLWQFLDLCLDVKVLQLCSHENVSANYMNFSDTASVSETGLLERSAQH